MITLAFSNRSFAFDIEKGQAPILASERFPRSVASIDFKKHVSALLYSPIFKFKKPRLFNIDAQIEFSIPIFEMKIFND